MPQSPALGLLPVRLVLVTLALTSVSVPAGAETPWFEPDRVVSASVGAADNVMPALAFTDDGVAQLAWGRGDAAGRLVVAAQASPGGEYGMASVISRDASGPLTGMRYGPTMRARGSRIAVGWDDSDNMSRGLWAVRSTSAGMSWDLAKRADPGTMVARIFDSVGLFPDGRLSQVWMGFVSGWNEPGFYWTVEDGMGGFRAPVEATATAPDEVCNCCTPDQVILDDGTVLVAFRQNEADLREIHVARSIDGGASFPVQGSIDSTGWILGACPNSGPSISADGTVAIAAWMSAGTGETRIHAARTTDGGLSWEPMQTLDPGGVSEMPGQPKVAIRGGLAVIVWDARETISGEPFIFAAISTDAGASFGGAVRVSADAVPAMMDSSPSVAISPSGGIEVAWRDRRQGSNLIYSTRGLPRSAAMPIVQRETLDGRPNSAAAGAILADGLPDYRALSGAGLPFTDPQPVLLVGSAALVFYAVEDPALPQIGIRKNVAADSVDLVQLR